MIQIEHFKKNIEELERRIKSDTAALEVEKKKLNDILTLGIPLVQGGKITFNFPEGDQPLTAYSSHLHAARALNTFMRSHVPNSFYEALLAEMKRTSGL